MHFLLDKKIACVTFHLALGQITINNSRHLKIFVREFVIVHNYIQL